jgi:hypothetical protein
MIADRPRVLWSRIRAWGENLPPLFVTRFEVDYADGRRVRGVIAIGPGADRERP